MNKKIICLFALLFFLPAATAQAGKQEAARNEAIVAAMTWLALVDQNQYKKSWQQAAHYFQSAISEQKWVQSLTAARTPLGSLKTRSLLDSHYKTALPGAPDGEYVIVQFTTSFSNKAKAVETITPMRGADGVWRVSGYFIQ